MIAAPACSAAGANPAVPPAEPTADATLDLEFVGEPTPLTPGSVAAAEITGSREAEQRVADLVARGEFTEGLAPGRGRAAEIEEDLRVHAFGSGPTRTVIVSESDDDVIARRGRNAAGQQIFEVGVAAGALADPDTGAGSAVQAAPGNSRWLHHASGGWNITVGNHFDRHVDYEIHKVYRYSEQTGANCEKTASHCRDWWRVFLSSAGGGLTGGSGKKMERMWVEINPADGWPTIQEKGSPEPRTTISTGGNSCVTHGWGIGVNVGLPPIGFSTESTHSNQVCRPHTIEEVDPINRSTVGRHGSQWKHYEGGITGSREVASSVTTHHQAKNDSHPGWYFWSGQSEDL